ncbi:MAG: GTPase Era [Bacteroidia bacterium]|nr:GTPase Era [Bacteroidia bacterium]
MAHKAGFVSIIGKPNVGKSTLSNKLVGERLSVVTPKASTTRHRIFGIINTDEYQIVFSDTPGIIEPAYKLHEGMMDIVNDSVNDADVILFVADVADEGPEPHHLEKLKQAKCPVILVLNKMDLSNQKEVSDSIEKWKDIIPFSEILPISAISGFNVDGLLKLMLQFIPEHEPYYPKDQLTDRPERFFITEIIRGVIFDLYDKEIPYSTEVVIIAYEEGVKLDKIYANIIVERQSQKGIVIGKLGEGIKRIGTTARKDIELFLQKKVFLDLKVKVEENWRKDDRKLQKFGYINK